MIIDLRREDSDVKIIAMSGGTEGSSNSYLQLVKGFGADLACNKPLGEGELLDIVRKVLGGA